VYYCGIDLHARTMHVCVVDGTGRKLFHENVPARRAEFLQAIAPYREGLVVAVECIYCWYWLADVCAEEGIAFVLGHALYMKAIHGGKVKSDRIDSEKIAQLVRSGLLPQAYVYPRAMRSTRDLLRRRLHFVRQRAELLAHVQITHHQYNLAPPAARLSYRANRSGVAACFSDHDARRNVELDLALVGQYDTLIRDLELHLEHRAKEQRGEDFLRLKTWPGIGRILAMTLLYEIDDIARFPRVQDFASYARLVRCGHESAGKTVGHGGKKIGNVYLKWALSEVAVSFLHASEEAKKLHARLVKKHGKGKALSILAHKVGRGIYFMLARKRAFTMEKLMAA
jgi:transposase